MITERTIHGAWRVSDIIDAHLVTRTYIGYTKREAQREFRRATKAKPPKKDRRGRRMLDVPFR